MIGITQEDVDKLRAERLKNMPEGMRERRSKAKFSEIDNPKKKRYEIAKFLYERMKMVRFPPDPCKMDRAALGRLVIAIAINSGIPLREIWLAKWYHADEFEFTPDEETEMFI